MFYVFLHDIYHIIRMEQDNLYNLLQSIDTPDDLRHLSADKLPEVCKELRQKIIDELSCNPGHFGSSLGVIELTVALHYVFNTPYDPHCMGCRAVKLTGIKFYRTPGCVLHQP